MNKEVEHFEKHLLRSIDDLKHGRVEPMDFSDIEIDVKDVKIASKKK